MKKSELRSLIREQVKNVLTEADMTRSYDGFIVLDQKNKKTYKFKYVKGRKNTDVENEAFAKLMKATGLASANFGVRGFVKKGEWNTDKTPIFTEGKLKEAASQEAYVIHRITRAGQDTVQNFIDNNKLDGKKLAAYVRQHSNSKEKYDVRDIIAGTGVGANVSFKARFLKQFKESVIKEEILNAPGQTEWPRKFYITYDDLPANFDLRTPSLNKLFQGIPYQHLGYPQDSDDGALIFKTAQDLAKAKQLIGLKESNDPESGKAAPYGSGYAEVNEDAGMVVDVAMGVAAGLMGLWALVKSASLVGRVFGDSAEHLANKFEKEAKMALKNHRKETIAPIIAKFKNDKQLADMYQNLTPYSAAAKMGSSQAGLKAQQGRVNQLTKIGKYIKSKLTPEELVYFRDISAMLRDGDLKESKLNEEITLNSPSFKKLVLKVQEISDKTGNDWDALKAYLKGRYAFFETYTEGTNPAAYVVNFFAITKGKDSYVKKRPQDYVQVGEWYIKPW